ncbi:MarR family transcriptional regulator [Paenibacillus sp. MY03]|uniref:MarR family transcriptional regulator n=1 Tax=Paenibacillus agaridevorans TaxID=171404 RepID=A0A2R5F0S1_9BACL|nr:MULTISPECIES: MarR family transcriptional regulator [Paenibacillus]OUS69268.1 MarR family transcriptional regulator [Paenibacillus sp. MY03]GBG10968.1 MarR family transcriptional regulator [Paenibacillus agaridevorans]
MHPIEHMKLDNQICFAIYASSREITKLYRPLLQNLGLTYTQYVTMLALWEKDNATVSELGTKLYLDSGTLTPLLKKLEAAGLVKRTRDKKDERSVLVTLTPDGEALREKAIDIPEQLACKLDATPEEGAMLLGQMQELLDRVKRYSAQPGEE